MSKIADTPAVPYYAVIFTSLRSEGDNGYAEMADKMVALAATQPGFLGLETAREEISCIQHVRTMTMKSLIITVF